MELFNLNVYNILKIAIDNKSKKIYLAVIIIISLIFTLASLYFPLIIKNIITELEKNKVSVFIICYLILFLILRSVMESINEYLIAKLGNIVIKDLQQNIYDRIVNYPISFFDEYNSGDLSSRLVNDTEVIKDLITFHIPKVINGLVMIVGAVCLIVLLDWKLTVLILLISPVIFGIIFPLMKKLENTGEIQQNEISNFISKTQETFKNIRMVKASTAEQSESKSISRYINNLFKVNLYESKVMSLVSPLVNLLLIFGLLIIAGYGAYRIQNDTLTLSTLIAFIIYSFQLMSPISSISSFIGEYHKSNGAFKSLTVILSKDIENAKNTYKYNFKLEDKLIFDNVSLEFKEKKILDNISFKLNKGESLTIIGPSGSGKTTLLNVIEKFYYINSGSITIDGIDINDINTQNLRYNIGLVSQDIPIISGTIKDNLLYGLNNVSITNFEIKDILKSTMLKDLVINQIDGINSYVGESGNRLSGGEKQRINIGRVLLKNPNIILLDEATSNLDNESKSEIINSISEITQDKTVLKITHNMHELKEDEQILFIENGKIIFKGKHGELLKNNERYKKFIKNEA
ncbi:ABC transporter (plasmid) [Staphylococcus epidermidis ATCC 12228]|jgi:ATP-binding cassette subfamily B protein AbcA/BmrA|uniref:ABC transporter n=2 Tax=root TaxID=1 RepID=A0A0H2VKC6_STAES|nr:ABC transporter [Staphylococcus epidermidis ATCC 12228]KAB1896664.1 ABC transporter ATP-binding protein [Staphylococcus epidermidis ATCC 12228]OOD00566.1 ABC transporter [Staphylococcus epidermidis]